MTNLRMESEPGWCTWDNCRFKASSRYPLTLCDDHIMVITSLVADIDRQDPKPQTKARANVIGSVYFLKVGDRIKVGYASDLPRRIRQYPPGVELLAVRPGTISDEHVEHSLLAAHRVEGREWYAINDETLHHIAAIIEKHGQPPTITGRRDARRRSSSPVGRPGAPSKIA